MLKTKHLKQLITPAISIALAMAVIAWTFPPSVPNFNDYPAGAERKQVFFNYFLPLIEQHNQTILDTRQQIIQWYEKPDDISWWSRHKLNQLAEQYKIDDFNISNQADWDTLIKRVDIVPPSLALAQAAKESGWGTSRFGREGNNYYGQWCYRAGCGIVPNSRANGKSHELAVFDSPKAAVNSYIHNLNSHRAYRSLRNIRAKLRSENQPVTGLVLAEGLSKYSERGTKYVKELRWLIKQNKLLDYDVY